MNPVINEELQSKLMPPDIIPEIPKKILFVCSGNTCRSPMAAAYLNYIANGNGIYALSAGLYPKEGEPISPNAVLALEKKGISSCDSNPYLKHTATAVTAELVLSCDRIIGLTENHAMMLIQRFPITASKITSFAYDIPDPYGGDEKVYSLCLDKIAAGIDDMFPYLTKWK